MMTKGRIINLVLKENFKRIELRIPCECELFMIDLPTLLAIGVAAIVSPTRVVLCLALLSFVMFESICTIRVIKQSFSVHKNDINMGLHYISRKLLSLEAEGWAR